jgi:hypothetical protein
MYVPETKALEERMNQVRKVLELALKGSINQVKKMSGKLRMGVKKRE